MLWPLLLLGPRTVRYVFVRFPHLGIVLTHFSSFFFTGTFCQGKGGNGTFGPCEQGDVHWKSSCNVCGGQGYKQGAAYPAAMGIQMGMPAPGITMNVSAPPVHHHHHHHGHSHGHSHISVAPAPASIGINLGMPSIGMSAGPTGASMHLGGIGIGMSAGPTGISMGMGHAVPTGVAYVQPTPAVGYAQPAAVGYSQPMPSPAPAPGYPGQAGLPGYPPGYY